MIDKKLRSADFWSATAQFFMLVFCIKRENEDYRTLLQPINPDLINLFNSFTSC